MEFLDIEALDSSVRYVSSKLMPVKSSLIG